MKTKIKGVHNNKHRDSCITGAKRRDGVAKTAFFIAVGSELLSFKPNLYSPLLADRLDNLGISLEGEMTSGDGLEEIKKAAKFALAGGFDFIICCGGLGPTFDDLTRQAFSKVLKTGLYHSVKIEKFLKKRYSIKKLPHNIQDQCLALKGAKLFENPDGTAFGEALKYGKKIIALLPGPRNEWEAVWEKGFGKYLLKTAGKREPVKKHRFKIADMREMEVQNLLKPLMAAYPGADYTVLAGPSICEFFFKAAGKQRSRFGEIKKEIEKLLGDKIYGEGTETLGEKLGEILVKKRKTFCAAESCTGGLASNLITDVPGSSVYFKGAINAYSNGSKMKLLKVARGTLKKFGAVSAECAAEMAVNARKLFGADYAVSVTGIAGPGGGTAEKPVGLVYFGLSSPRGIFTLRKNFRGPRSFIKNCSANTALYAALKLIKYGHKGD